MQPSQDGHATLGTWNEGTGGVYLLVRGTGAQRSIAGLQFATDASPLGGGTLDVTVGLDFTQAPTTLQLSWIPEAEPAPFANGALPGQRGDLLVAEINIAANADAGTELQFAIGQTPNAANAVTCAETLAAMRDLTAVDGWGGTLAFSVAITGAVTMNLGSLDVGVPADFVGIEAPAEVVGAQAARRYRPLRGEPPEWAGGILGALEREQMERKF